MSSMDREIGTGRMPVEAVERWLRRALLCVSLLILCGLAAIAIHLLLQPAPPLDIYFDLRRQARLVYLACWMCIGLLAGALALFRRTQFVSFWVILLIAAEGGAHAYFHARNGRLYQPMSRVLLARFEPHPLLVGIPHPGTYGPVSHDADHRRTTVNEGKAASPAQIFTFGGSSTYDIGVGDAVTWSSELSRLLGEDFAVENLGVPGYSSLENMIQSLFVFRKAGPSCAIYYVGWNDLRNSHLEGLRDDYSDFELPSQIGNLAVGHRPGFLENNVLLLRLVAASIAGKEETGGGAGALGRTSGEKDPRLSRIFTENMRLIAEIDRHFGVKPVFVPQVLNYARFTDGWSSGWIPLVPDRDVKALMEAMNSDLAEVARQTGTLFLDRPLSLDWQDSDFVDSGHFSEAGARKFARAIAGDVAAGCRRGE